MSDQLYIPTDARGTQYFGESEIRWSLPVLASDGSIKPARLTVAEGSTPLNLFSLDGLLDQLSERIFLAELDQGAGAESASFGVKADAARLVDETKWSLAEAARFALDCARHALGDDAGTKLPSGATLGDVLDAAERWLDKAEHEDGPLLGRISRLATARRLKKRSGEVSDRAFVISAADAELDRDALEDAEWAELAATRDAVLAAVEAIRHRAFPHLLEDENVRYELDNESTDEPPEIVETPWGNFLAGRRSGVVPAWIAARDAAERARQAAADTGGEEAGTAERAWQRDRLLAALGEAGTGPDSL